MIKSSFALPGLMIDTWRGGGVLDFWLGDWKWGNFVTLPVLYTSVSVGGNLGLGKELFFSPKKLVQLFVLFCFLLCCVHQL